MKNIVANPAAFALSLPELQNHPYFLSVAIARDIDVATAVRLSGLPLEEFNALNPQLNKPVILAAGTPQLLLPYDNANAFVKGIEAHQGPLASWTAWVAPRTMKTAEAANQVGMSDADLRAVNNIPPRMLIKAGSTLLVPRDARRHADVSEKVADDATMALTYDGPAVRRMVFRAGKKGDSVAAVAKRYGVNVDQVAHWNHVGATAQFAPGSSVVVFVAARSRKATPARASAGKASTKRPAASAKGGAAPLKPVAAKKAPARR
jgi:membrane-bound lytic murein transglycosylase D